MTETEDLFLNNSTSTHKEVCCSSYSCFRNCNNNHSHDNNEVGANNNNNNNTTTKKRSYHKTLSSTETDDDPSSSNNNFDIELAKEMNELSVEERERVLEDVHGVATPVHEETPQFVNKCIKSMNACIKKSSKSNRRAYEKALFFRPTIDQDWKFKLMFLRADNYDPNKAAKRLLKYYQDKLDIFCDGDDTNTILARDITLEDLTDDDRTVFATGWASQLPHKDQVGRPIWFFDMQHFNLDCHNEMIRSCWYLIMCTIQNDEIAQKKGVVDIAFAPGDLLKLVGYSVSKFTANLNKAGEILVNLPMRITSYHFCYNDARMKFLSSIMGKSFGKDTRLRLRTHTGSQLEMQYSLLSFGIPCQILLPSNNKNRNNSSISSISSSDDRDGNNHEINNNSSNKHEEINVAIRQLHQTYIQNRRKIERQEKEAREYLELETGIIYYPQEDDVIMGRGRPYQEHKGNIRFGKVIDSYLDEYYKQTDRFAKTCISMQIVKQVQEYGGRFLERHVPTGTWRVIDDLAAREKTAIGFRSRVSKFEKNPDSTTVISSPSAANASRKISPSSSSSNRSSEDDNNHKNKNHDDIAIVSPPTKEAKRLRYDTSVLTK